MQNHFLPQCKQAKHLVYQAPHEFFLKQNKCLCSDSHLSNHLDLKYLGSNHHNKENKILFENHLFE